MMHMETKRMTCGVSVLLLNGDLDTAHLVSFKDEVSQLLNEGFTKVIIDCRDIGFISNTGVSALLWARSSANGAGGQVYLTGVSTFLSSVGDSTRMSKLLRTESVAKRRTKKVDRFQKLTGNRKRALVLSAERS